MNEKPAILQLSEMQLEAYNRQDIDAFCDCYHDDVVILDEAGNVKHQGIEAFRNVYAPMFEAYQTEAWITERICMPPHIVEKEFYQRRKHDTGEEASGQVIVRYTEKDGKIAIVMFLR